MFAYFEVANFPIKNKREICIFDAVTGDLSGRLANYSGLGRMNKTYTNLIKEKSISKMRSTEGSAPIHIQRGTASRTGQFMRQLLRVSYFYLGHM